MKAIIMANKILFSIEFNFHCSPQLLFQYLSTPSGLSEWFADDVNSRGEDFTFIWEDSEEYAKLLTKKNNELVKFMWVNDEEDYQKYFFEFLITVDEITKDVSLTVTDFSDDDELEESKMLWTNLVGDLKQVLGAV
tara:strand:- start:167 stop:574 length:408 start_codon:yes stop_codon:yes gene_type:complete